MDKYEFNIKIEQIKKLINKNDFETAMKIADTIDWRRVRNANLLSMIAQVYEKNEEYQEAKEILLLAFERAPIGKRLLYKLAELAIKEGKLAEAEDYYREFCDLAPEDPRQHLLRYMILKAKKAPVEQLLHSLEGYTNTELDEKWLYELAELYSQAGRNAECVNTCDRIMLMFGLGKYVDKAMSLKIQYQPLTTYQMDLVENRDKYEAKLRAVEQKFNGDVKRKFSREVDYTETEDYEEDSAPQTIDEELVASIHQAETEERLAEEMSRISIEDYAELDDPTQHTKIIGNIRQITEIAPLMEAPQEVEGLFEAEVEEAEVEEAEAEVEIAEDIEVKTEPVFEELDEEPISSVVNHLMIEARTPEKGLEIAIEALKKIHRETGTKNPVVKINGLKLSKKGIFEVADKLAGKDLVIEEAGDLTAEAMEDLQVLIEDDNTGMIVVLIDNPRQMEDLHGQNPEFARMFECIGVQDTTEADIERAALEKAALERAALERAALERADIERADIERADIERAVLEKADIEKVALEKADIEKVGLRRVDAQEKIAKEVAEIKPLIPEAIPVTSDQILAASRTPVPEPIASEEEDEMDLDEFAEYACKYAGEIDCSIAGKSMLALYERIEIMEEDGIALTRANAEELIEEAADRAEKPSFGRLLSGVFSSKYDKDGLLILKEEHFIY